MRIMNLAQLRKFKVNLKPLLVSAGCGLLLSAAGIWFLPAQARSEKPLVSGVQGVAQGLQTPQWLDGVDFIQSLYKSTEALKQYRVVYHMTTYKGNKRTEESGIFYFKQPKLMRAEVTSGPRKGALAVLGADGQISGHLGGFLRIFSGTLAPDSKWTRLPNDYPMAGSDFRSLIDYLRNMLKNGDLSRVSPEPVAVKYVNSKVYVVEMYRGELIIKRIFVDPRSNLPAAWEDYTDGRLSAVSIWDKLDTSELANSIFTH